MPAYLVNLPQTQDGTAKTINDFSNEEGIQWFSASKYNINDITPYLSLLPPSEADIMLMYCLLKKDQAEIAKIMQMSQGGVSHKIDRAKERLKYIVQMPKFTQEEMLRDLKPYLDGIDLSYECCWLMYKTTSQSVVAREVKLTQSGVRHKFMRSIKELKLINDPKHLIYITAFEMVTANPNILHEIILPRWIREKSYSDHSYTGKNDYNKD